MKYMENIEMALPKLSEDGIYLRSSYNKTYLVNFKKLLNFYYDII